MTAQSAWIAAYQKSGTTWTRFLVRRLLGGPFQSSAEVDQAVPNIHGTSSAWQQQIAQGGGVLATHKCFDALVARYGECVSGFVHVVRHPADVLLSEARFHCLSHAGTVQRTEGEITKARLDQMFREYLTVILHQGESARHARMGMGSWATHALSWLLARPRHPHVVIRYEDLTRQPRVEVHRLAEFLGVSATDTEIDEVVSDCSVQTMRRMQEREVANREVGSLYFGEDWEPAYALGLRFVGRGVSGQGFGMGRAALSRIETLFGPVMKEFGYTTDPEHPVLDRPGLQAVLPLPVPPEFGEDAHHTGEKLAPA